MNKNILVISGTRAEFGLLKSTIDKLLLSKLLQPKLLVTGMHTLKKYGETINEIKKSNIIINHIVQITEHGEMLDWLSEEIIGIKNYCKNNKINCILVLGDRDEPFAGAIVGSHLGIPIAHIHGGDISGKNNVDDYIRNAITQLSNFHFAATKESSKRIINIRGDKNVYIVGAPGIDAINDFSKISKETLAKKMNLSLKKKWIILLMHPVSLEKKVALKRQIQVVLKAIDKINEEIILIYPNSDTGSNTFIYEIEKMRKKSNIHIFKNIKKDIFLNLLTYANLLIGNSSSAIIESTYFHLPVVNIGNRQEGRERSTNIISVEYNSKNILKVIKKALSDEFIKISQNAKQLYGNGKAGKKIVSILEKNI